MKLNVNEYRWTNRTFSWRTTRKKYNFRLPSTEWGKKKITIDYSSISGADGFFFQIGNFILFTFSLNSSAFNLF